MAEEMDIETKAETVLATFPAELQKRWRDFFEESEDQQAALAQIMEIADRREKITQNAITDDDFQVEFTGEANRRKEEWKAAVLEDIRKILKLRAVSIGFGKTAEVYERRFKDGSTSDYCIKVIYNTKEPEYAQHNDIKTEFSHLDKLTKLEVDGVRISKPYAYIQNKGAHILVMEKFNAITLASIFEGINKIPEGFNPEIFFAKLERFVQKMHALHFHHRDLHAGNIMIDRQTLMPLVIDLGKTKEVFGSDDPYLELNTGLLGDESKSFMNDLTKIQEHKRVFQALLNNTKKGGQPR
jgi:serine/threonine protein kinase